MPRQPMSQAEFDNTVRELKMAVNGLHGVVNEFLPDGFIFDPEFDEWMRTGCTFYTPRMEHIGKAIAGVVEWFDLLQRRLGIPPGTMAKFENYLRPGRPEDRRRRRKTD